MLDITFRVEKGLRIRIDRSEFAEPLAEQGQRDVTVSGLAFAIRRAATCGTCCYSLRGHGTEGLCPECGRSFGPLGEDHVYKAVHRAVIEALGVRRERVTPDAWLIRDLGLN